MSADARLEALCGLISFLSEQKDADDDRVWTRVTEKLAAALDCERATYFVYLPKGEQLVARAGLGAAHGGDARRMPAGRGLSGWVAKYREPLMVEDAPSDARYAKDADEPAGRPTRRALAVPFFERGELAGVIELAEKRAGAFEAADLALAQSACQAAATALRALRLETTVDKVTAHNASILENLGGGFVAIDAHGRVMLCNPAAKRLLGLADDFKTGRTLEESLPEIPEMGDILMDTLVKKQTVKRQDLWWKRRGDTRVLGYSTLLIQDPRGQVVGAGITFQDITQFQKK